jgi:hypothetical protein
MPGLPAKLGNKIHVLGAYRKTSALFAAWSERRLLTQSAHLAKQRRPKSARLGHCIEFGAFVSPSNAFVVYDPMSPIR